MHEVSKCKKITPNELEYVEWQVKNSEKPNKTSRNDRKAKHL
jgi:hypothetical protein